MRRPLDGSKNVVSSSSKGPGSCKSLRLTGAARGGAGGKKKPGDNCGGPASVVRANATQRHNNEVPAKSKAINSII